MTGLSTEQLQRCRRTLEASLERYRQAEPGSLDAEVYRNAVNKGFELSLETAGKLLRQALREFSPSPRQVDALVFKEVLRQAARVDLLAPEAVGRWFLYRDSRNSTAHDYGESLAQETLTLIDDFLADLGALLQALERLDA